MNERTDEAAHWLDRQNPPVNIWPTGGDALVYCNKASDISSRPTFLGMGSMLTDADRYRGSDDIAPRLPPSTRAKIHVGGSTHTTYRE